ncbi:permease prefix domain 1-containing protein [Micromonospora sp. WMMD1082]|uniref:permease prefix domain 1-containing protein n=1 Tax=Micromonospora sp. WMMD1082 TaxID=3016104 RepID=UPI002417E221|nr:permease prefix domain 1-containing protein [Micromonospora sp. WMMD1082]MDG4793369.1 permease prefix domain 1-containing protein [Micromonospora sp. WMMD1082]
MPVGDDVLVEEHLRQLAGRLRGPRRLRADLMTEARHGLLDAVEAYRDSGLPAREASRQAVAEFGTPDQLAPAYQAELAVAALRGLSLRVGAFAAAASVAGDLTWRGSTWSAGPRPPDGYLLLSQSVEWIWAGAFLLGLAGLLLVTATARSASPALTGLARTVGTALTGAAVLGALAGAGLFTWSFLLWDAALTWPPMVIGMVAATAAHVWVGRAARVWLLATR